MGKKELNATTDSVSVTFTESFLPAVSSADKGLGIPSQITNTLRDLVAPHYYQQLARRFGGPAEVAVELQQVADTSLRFLRGDTHVPSSQDFLSPSAKFETERLRLATTRLQGVIAFALIHAGRLSRKGLEAQVGKIINDTAMMMGRYGHEQVATAFENLSETERAVLFSIMSRSIKAELGYPDRYECSEEEMCAYIHDAIWGKHGVVNEQAERKHNFGWLELEKRVGVLLEAMYDRDGRSFSASNVLDRLLSAPYREDTIRRVIEVAYFLTNQLDLLEEMLQTNNRTVSYARMCREYLDGTRRMVIPSWMRDEDNRQIR